MIRRFIGIDCDGYNCPLGERLDCVPTEVYRSADRDSVDILFIGDAPRTVTRGRGGALLDDPSRVLLRRALRYAQPPETNWAMTQLVRCLPVGRDDEPRQPTVEERKRCRQFLDQDIERLDPRVIVAFGGLAAAALGQDGADRGDWREVEVGGRTRVVLTTWHPGHVGRDKNMIPMFYQDIERAFRLAGGWRPDPRWAVAGRSMLLKTVDELDQAIERIRATRGYVAVDVETRNLNKQHGNQLAFIQFAWGPGDAVCIPVHHPKTPFPPQEVETVVERLRALFTEPIGIRGWIAHFGKFEQIQIGRDILAGGTIRNAPMYDTGAFAYLLDENGSNFKGSYTLKKLARTVLRFNHYDAETLTLRSGGNLLSLPLESPVPYGEKGWVPNLTDYGGMDAYVTFRLFEALCLEADRQDYLRPALRLLRYLFSPVFGLLAMIERNGFWANLAYLNELRDPIRSPIIRRLREIDDELVPQFETAQRTNTRLVLRQSGGTPALFDEPWVLDLQKDAHVRAWLLDECGLKPLQFGKSGAPSVDKGFFTEYRGREEVALVEERRGLAKLASAYIKQLIGYIDPQHPHKTEDNRNRQVDSRDGRIRCNIHFTSTTTGRASASNPNMQQQVRSNTPAKAALKSIFQAEQPGVQGTFEIDFSKGPPGPTVDRKPENCLVQLDFMANEVRWWCGTGDTLVSTACGLRRLDELTNRTTPGFDRIEGMVDTYAGTASVTYAAYVGEKPCRKLTTRQGYAIEGGDDHSVLIFDKATFETKYIALSNMRPGDYVVMQRGSTSWPDRLPLHFVEDIRTELECSDCSRSYRNLAVHYRKAHDAPLPIGLQPVTTALSKKLRHSRHDMRLPIEMTPALAELLGLLVSEGSINRWHVDFANKDGQLIAVFGQLCNEVFGFTPPIGKPDGDGVRHGYITGDAVRFIKWLGCTDRDINKKIPWSILQAPRPCVIAFLRGLWEGDGYAGRQPSYASASKQLVDQLAIVLLRLGIVGTIDYANVVYRLLLCGINADAFLDLVKFNTAHRVNQRVDVNRIPGTLGEHIPGVRELVDDVKARSPGRRQGRYVTEDGSVTVAKLKFYNACRRGLTAEHVERILPFLSIVETARASRLRDLISREVIIQEVVSVEQTGIKQVYDITVAKEHNYVGNGFINHNCIMSGCPDLAKALNNGKAARDVFRANPTDELRHAAKVGGDIHKQTSSLMFELPIDDVDKDMRHAAKTIVFGAIYGRGINALADQIKKSTGEAQKLLDKFSGAFPVGWAWIQGQPAVAQQQWYVASPIDRRRRLFGYLIRRPRDQMSKDDMRLVGQCNRMAMNSPIQGVASDASFIGSALFAQYIEENDLPWLVQNIVHDSCVYQVPIRDLRRSIEVAERIFTTGTMAYLTKHWGVEFNCPIEVEFEVGLRWGELMGWDFTAPGMDKILAALV